MRNLELFLRGIEDQPLDLDDPEFFEEEVRRCLFHYCRERRRRTPQKMSIIPSLIEAVDVARYYDFNSRWEINSDRFRNRLTTDFAGPTPPAPARLPGDQPPWQREPRPWNAVLYDQYDQITNLVLDDLQGRVRWDDALRQYFYLPVLPSPLLALRSNHMLLAFRRGLGWLIPTDEELFLVPLPRLHTLDGDGDNRRLHNDQGFAIEWGEDLAGYYFLQGVQFEPELYWRIVKRDISAREALMIRDVDQRSAVLSMLGPNQLIEELGAELIDVGVKGTRLYRIRDFQIRGHGQPRVAGRGNNWSYFIYMRDASHAEREFIEWVDPEVGQQGNAELCQAVAFGITLEEWLSIEQEG